MLIIRRKINNAWLQEHAPIILLLIAISLLFTLRAIFLFPVFLDILALTFIAHQLALSLIKRIQGCKQGLLFGDLRGIILKFARARINLGVGENG
jgi:hypothetical protein